jgi:hypothetical protein
MKKSTAFTFKLLILVIGLIIADKTIGALLRHFYFQSKHGEQKRLTYVLDSVNHPVLILGASKALRQYASPIIADSLHLPCYNTGKDKQGIYYNLAILKAVLARYHPQVVILDLHPLGLTHYEELLDDLSVLLPYYDSHIQLRPIIDKRSYWEPVKTWSTLYRYNSLALQIAANQLSHAGDSGIVDGYAPKHETMRRPPYSPYSPASLTAATDPGIVAAFEEIITSTIRAGGRPVVVVSPVYFPIHGGTTTTKLAAQLCERYHIPFLNYMDSTAFLYRNDLFFDEAHLDESGSAVFTQMLCKDLVAKGFRKREE